MNDHSHIACAECNYNLMGIDLAGLCPECGTKIINNCFRCDYDLNGLDPKELCPECGLPIEHSIGRGAIAIADDDYLKKLHTGVFLVQTAIIIIVAQAIFGGLFGYLAATTATFSGLELVFDIAAQVVSLGASLMYLVGWYKFSTPCPLQGMFYTGSKARKLVRVTVVIAFCFALLQLIAQFSVAYAPNIQTAFVFIYIVLIGSYLVIFVRFIAEIMYVRWMAPLLKNKRVHKRATVLLWMGPIIIGAGLVAGIMTIFAGIMTIFIGFFTGILLLGVALAALVALIMYWNMLDWIRKDLKSIRQSNLARVA
ncbi:MAG: hypothetical protein AB8C13_03885 [Phycisphaerales bacterium]